MSAATVHTGTIRIGTRTSQLALWQTQYVAAQLESAWPGLHCELVHISTQGDRRLDRPLPEIGGKGLFTAELEAALHDGTIDLAVHSLKDLPVENAPKLTLGAVLNRADVRDVLVARQEWTLLTLPQGAVVGTSSLRRQAQLLARRPDLAIRPIRGNVETRLRKVFDGEYDAAVMAAAGISRLELAQHITEWLDPTVLLPAPGQGALAVQCREDNARILELLTSLDHAAVRMATTTERRLLWQLGGGCSAPIGAYATVEEGGYIRLNAAVATLDGSTLFYAQGQGTDPAQIAAEVAENLLSQGADEILAAIQQAAQMRTVQTSTAPQSTSTDARHTPLANKRIAITRAAEQAEEFAALLQAAEAVPVVVPLIKIAPVQDSEAVRQALQNLAHYDWVLFTSANAVRAFAAQLKNESLAPAWAPPRPRVAAVGPATASVLQMYGIPCEALPDQYAGAVLAEALGGIQGNRILLPRSAIGAPDLPEALRAHGATVDDVPIYTTLPAAPNAADMQVLLTGADAITFTSGSTVRAFMQALPDDVAPDEIAPSIACIGPSTAQAAREAGLRVDVVAAEHTIPGLVDALGHFFDAASDQPGDLS